MGGDDYLAEFNKPGLSALRAYLASGQAVAFLGAGVSAPLYPLWTGLIGDLVDAAAERMSADEAATCRALAQESPEEVVEIIRQQLGVPNYRTTARSCARSFGPELTQRPAVPGPRFTNWCAAARSRRS
jgi:hypothetical protein